MSFINKQGDAAINMKLTSIGRQLVAYGKLNFSKFSVGDSEIDYQSIVNDNYDGGLSMILRPVDNQPNIKYTVPRLNQDTTTKYPVSVPYPSDTQIVNSALERGFFKKETSSSPYALDITQKYIRKTVKVDDFVLGGTVLNLKAESGAATGDYVLVQWFTPNSESFSGNPGDLNPTRPATFIWYKVVAVAGTTITVDKPLPNFGDNTGGGNVYVFPGGDSVKSYYGPDAPEDYWDENLIAFNATRNATYIDVPVWNLSIVYGNTVAGATEALQHNNYPTKVYEGARTYLNNSFLLTNSTKPIGLVHYTNYTVENFYGEGLFGNTFTLELPTVMYHGQTSAKLGMTIKAGGTKKLLSSFGGILATPYFDLLDESKRVVGKVLLDLKLAIIEDAEILSAISYNSNRNWTLPQFKSLTANPDDVDTDNAQTLWITYRFANGDGTNSYDINGATTYGFNNALHNQNYSFIPKLDINNLDYVEFKFDYNDLKFIVDASNINSARGTGFIANRLILMFQFAPQNTAPIHDRWVEIDYTPNLQGYTSFAYGAITRDSLSAQNYRITGDDIRSAINLTVQGVKKYYELDYIGDEETPSLTFGEEVFTLGNIKTDIQATSYQTRFTILLNAAEFAVSRNPTWNLGSPVYISEIGIYDDNDNLVAMGKLNYPIKKDAYSIRFITADLDF